MKTLKLIPVITALTCVPVGVSALADNPTNSPPAGATNAAARAKKGHGNNPHDGGHVVPQSGNDHAAGSNSATPPADVTSLVQQFQKDRATYVTQQQQLLLQLKQARGGDRAAIRDQLRDLRDKWSDAQNQLREEIRDRLQEIKTELKNQRDEQLNDAGSPGDGRHPKH
ncbi:MAG: hypothetical protein KGS61_09345 [Verrucomicrobia bacterium]|nr:hypothetical protein [Verrucomicrobiota bacterium]